MVKTIKTSKPCFKFKMTKNIIFVVVLNVSFFILNILMDTKIIYRTNFLVYY